MRSVRTQRWERITYFLDRVIPVASEYKIRMALHPDDPEHSPRVIREWSVFSALSME